MYLHQLKNKISLKKYCFKQVPPLEQEYPTATMRQDHLLNQLRTRTSLWLPEVFWAIRKASPVTSEEGISFL